MAEKKKIIKPVRQDWKPHWSLETLQKVWMVLFTAFKIAVGAAATVLMICLVCMFVFVGVLGDYLENDILPSAEMELPGVHEVEQTSYMYYVDGDGNIQKLQQVYTDIDREWAAYDELPEDLINATIAIEDKRFYEHQGVDWITTIKACAKMFFGDDSVGGSSITQQLVKNIKEEKSVTVQRKVQEIFRAAQLEKKYDKKLIMEQYLSTIYLGNSCYGVKTAAATYFGKELEMLTTAECASLISITNNPSIFDPYAEAFEYKGKLMSGAQRNRDRQETVLYAMKEQGWITPDEYDAAMAQEMVFKAGIEPEDRMAQCTNPECLYRNTVSTLKSNGGNYYCPSCNSEIRVDVDSSKSMYSWFVDTVLEDVARALADQDGAEWNDTIKNQYKQKVQKGGYNIYTTLDMDVQEQVDEIYTDYDEIPSTRGGQQLQSAIVIIDDRSGDIVAMSGGVGPKTGFDEWNRATDAKLQSGSSIKPLSIYAPAFENGTVTPATVIKDMPLNYDDGAWPKNDDRTYRYSRTIYQAVVSSVNAVAAKTLEKSGVDYAYEFAKEKLGLSTLVDRYVDSSGTVHSDNAYAPLAMGAQTWGVTVRDMASAFDTFNNNGVYREARTFTKVYDSDGNLVLDNVQETRDVMSAKTVTYMNYCLVNAVRSGTGAEAYFSGVQIAGKTGTTADNKDRWFCGFTGYYTAAVWTGYDSPATVNPLYVNNPASVLWRKVMAPLHSGKSDVSLYDSGKLTTVSMCLDSGKLATSACKNDVRDVTRVASAGVYSEDLPGTYCDKHVEVDYCTSGNGVATEYCKHFAGVDSSVTIEKKALVKMTRKELDEIARARSYNLQDVFEQDGYVYLVDGNGSGVNFNGIYGTLHQSVAAPYVTCSVHTKAAWEAYTPPTPSEPEPTQPVVPSNPTAP